MARFNRNSKKVLDLNNAINHGGQTAFQEDPKLQIASLVLTSFVKDDFYSSALDEIVRLVELVKAEPYFAAQAAVYARNTVGMRSITHIVAALIANQIKGERWTRPFFQNVVLRPDDATEILSFYFNTFGRQNLPNSLKDGLGSSMRKFDAYQLGKYRGVGKSVSLVDLINLTHPNTSTWKNKDAITQLMTGTLRSTDTWEKNISEAGSNKEAKSEAWEEMVTSGKMGYLALIRNLRNIRDSVSEEVLNEALKQLKDVNAIQKSLMFPHQFLTAHNQFTEQEFNNPFDFYSARGFQNPEKTVDKKTLFNNRIRQAIEVAVEHSLSNVPFLPGSTLLAIDESSSMGGSSRGSETFADIASIFAAAIFKAQKGENTDVMVFATNARYMNDLNPRDSLMTIFNVIRNGSGGATNFNDIFNKAHRHYDRVIILSDMQALPMEGLGKNIWSGSTYRSTLQSMYKYNERFSANPNIYSLDLAGYGTLQFPEKNVYALAGFSEKVFDLMALMENDRNAMLSTIEKVDIEKR